MCEYAQLTSSVKVVRTSSHPSLIIPSDNMRVTIFLYYQWYWYLWSSHSTDDWHIELKMTTQLQGSWIKSLLLIKWLQFVRSLIWCVLCNLQTLSREDLWSRWFVLARFRDKTLWLHSWWCCICCFSPKNTFIFIQGNHGINMIHITLQGFPFING